MVNLAKVDLIILSLSGFNVHSFTFWVQAVAITSQYFIPKNKNHE